MMACEGASRPYTTVYVSTRAGPSGAWSMAGAGRASTTACSPALSQGFHAAGRVEYTPAAAQNRAFYGNTEAEALVRALEAAP